MLAIPYSVVSGWGSVRVGNDAQSFGNGLRKGRENACVRIRRVNSIV